MRVGGWQCWVDIYDTHVIKTLKKRPEIKRTVERYLRLIGKQEELKERVDKMLLDVKESIMIVKKTKAPLTLFGSPKFLKDNTIKQEKAIDIQHSTINKKNLSSILKLVETLWEYGIHEKTFKFFTNYGIINNEVILIDFLEITDKKETVIKQIKKESWNNQERFAKHMPSRLAAWFTKKATKTYSLENLEKHWMKKIARHS